MGRNSGPAEREEFCNHGNSAWSIFNIAADEKLAVGGPFKRLRSPDNRSLEIVKGNHSFARKS